MVCRLHPLKFLLLACLGGEGGKEKHVLGEGGKEKWEEGRCREERGGKEREMGWRERGGGRVEERVAAICQR